MPATDQDGGRWSSSTLETTNAYCLYYSHGKKDFARVLLSQECPTAIGFKIRTAAFKEWKSTMFNEGCDTSHVQWNLCGKCAPKNNKKCFTSLSTHKGRYNTCPGPRSVCCRLICIVWSWVPRLIDILWRFDGWHGFG